jgi:hypothetical protein
MGKVRVWINSNFSENQAEDIKEVDNGMREKNEEYEMVNDIIAIIF